MNKSEIAERLREQIFDELGLVEQIGPIDGRDKAVSPESVKIIDGFVERAIAESQPSPSLDSLVGLLTQLRTYYIQRDDPKVANWCMRVITEAKELQL